MVVKVTKGQICSGTKSKIKILFFTNSTECLIFVLCRSTNCCFTTVVHHFNYYVMKHIMQYHVGNKMKLRKGLCENIYSKTLKWENFHGFHGFAFNREYFPEKVIL